MDTPGNIHELIQVIEGAWLNWMNLVNQMQDKGSTNIGMGNWSLKDIIAHITWHEQEMVGLIQAHALVGSELWNLPTDERNAAIYEQVKDLPLEQVLAESEQVHQLLLEALPTLSNEDLIDPSSFPNMPPDWQPWMIIAQNTYEHYEDHMKDVEKWLADQNASLPRG